MVVLFLGTLQVAISGCAATPDPEPELPSPVTNTALNLTFGDLPEGFEVESNRSDELRLVSTTEGREGAMWVEVSERSDYGIDLVKIVNAQKANYEEREAGEYSGARQLMTPSGEGYYVRGRYHDSEQRLVEETRVYLVHPSENRLVALHYLYPAADDSAERLPELFGWLAEMSAAEPSATESSEPG